MNQHLAVTSRSGRQPEDPEPGERKPEVVWPVGVVSERLGIPAPTLRSWDRRHGVGPSRRTSGNHRRYTEVDIRRVRLMARLTGQGVPARTAANSLDGLDVLDVLDDDAAGSTGPGLALGPDPGLEAAGASELAEAIVGAARSLDARTVALLYRRALRQRDVGQAWVEVFAPALRRVGDLWAAGRLGVQAEHLTSELLQSELRAVVRTNRLRVDGPPVLLASAEEEQHHLPVLALEAELARSGVASLFLGPRVPAQALVSALREARPRSVFLWASLARPQADVFWSDLGVVDWPLSVVLGGPGWADGIVGPDGPVVLTRVVDFGSAVRALTASPRGLDR